MTPAEARAAAVAAWAAGDTDAAYRHAATGQRAAAARVRTLPAIRPYLDPAHVARRDRARAELADALRGIAARDARKAARRDAVDRVGRRMAASPWPAGSAIGAVAALAMLPDGLAVAAFTGTAVAGMVAAAGRMAGRP